jgi:hypothetical protein
MMAKTWLAAIVGFFPCLGGTSASTSPARLKTKLRMSNWFINYSQPTAPPLGIWTLITSDEGCLLGVTGPVEGTDLPDRCEIGIYHFPCAAADAEAVRGLLDPALAESAAAKGTASPRGTRFLSFGLGAKGADKVDRKGSYPLRGPLPPALSKFDVAVIGLARQTMAHPIMVLRAAASAAAHGPDDELRAVLQLTNVGTAPLQIRHPAAAEGSGVSLVLSDADEEVTFIDAKQGEVVQLGDDGKPLAGAAPELVKLEPAKTLALAIRIRRHLYLREGAYKLDVRFTSNTKGIPETEAIEGFVQTSAGHIHVGAKGKR